jgi:hypothetical protein
LFDESDERMCGWGAVEQPMSCNTSPSTVVGACNTKASGFMDDTSLVAATSEQSAEQYSLLSRFL